MKLTKAEKTYITRYIRLNQPCSLSDLTNDLCFNTVGPRIKLRRMYSYLFWASVTRNKIIIDPPIFDESMKTLLKGYTINDLLLKHIDSTIYIPNYISKVWLNWIVKKINEE